MSISYHTVFVWCFLMSVLQMWIVPADTKTVVNYREMSALVKNNKSVLVSGNDVELDSWLSKVQYSEYRVKGHDLNSIIMYTIFKCECAYYVNTIIVKSVRGIGIRDAIPYLIKLNEEIKKTLTILFEISDEYVNVKSSEPYFLKTLLMMSFYIDTFLSPSAQIHPDSEELQNKNMDRVIMQIVNLVEHYTIGYCKLGLEDDKGKDEKTLDVQLNEFRVFLEKFVYTTQTSANNLTTVVPYRPTNLNSIKFQTCSVGTVKGDLNKFCDYLIVAKIIRPDDTELSFFNLYDEVGSKSNSVESIYEYVSHIYYLLLKHVYLSTIAFWDDYTTSLDVDRCQRLISKLQMMRFPIEIIEHFKFVLRVDNYRNNYAVVFNDLLKNAKQIVEANANEIDNITPPLSHENLKLFELMDAVLDEELLQLWRVFNFLYNESDKTSSGVFENVSLSLQASDSENEAELKCETFAKVYRYCFNIGSVINTYLRPSENNTVEHNSRIKNCLCEIRNDHLLGLNNYLLSEVRELVNMEIYDNNEYLESYEDPTDIFLTATTILKNELNTTDEYCKESDGDGSQTDDSNTIINRKLLRFKRILNYIMNIVENYQIKKCKNRLNDKTEYSDILENHDETSQSSSLAVNDSVIETATSKIYDSKITSILSFYSLIYMMGEKDVINSTSLGTGIFFDWHGEVKSLREIYTDVMENLLDMHNLVDYQWTYFKWVIYLFYKMWYSMLRNQIDRNNGTNISRKFVLSAAIECLHKFNLIQLPEHCENHADLYFTTEFLQLYQIICTFHKHEYNSGRMDLIRSDMISVMTERLGVIKENSLDITDVQNFFSIDQNDCNNINGFSCLITKVQEKLNDIHYTFWFRPQADDTDTESTID